MRGLENLVVECTTLDSCSLWNQTLWYQNFEQIDWFKTKTDLAGRPILCSQGIFSTHAKMLISHELLRVLVLVAVTSIFAVIKIYNL